jgi:molybdopterin synthase catalytic subunit
MRLAVSLFAVLRDRAKADVLHLEIAGDSADLSALKEAVARACPALAPLMPIVRVALNQSFASGEDRIREGDEVALIPPVSGGSGRGPFEVVDRPIRTDEVEHAVAHPGAGAVVTFTGTVRDETSNHEVVALEYEAYLPMAKRYLEKIGGEIEAAWPGARAAILHRIGRLDVGEASVVIAVAAAHRGDAFAACRHAIERLKADVPIWKKEERKDGSVWVGVGS